MDNPTSTLPITMPCIKKRKIIEFIIGFRTRVLSVFLNFLKFSVVFFLYSAVPKSFPQIFTLFFLKQRFFHLQSHGKTPFRAVPPIFWASTSPWDNRNRFVSKKIMKNYMKWVWFLRKNLVSAEVVYAGWLAGGNWNCCQWVLLGVISIGTKAVSD